MRSFNAASLTLSPSWMSMARLALPSRLELNRPEGSFNAARLENVILTKFLYVSPVQTRLDEATCVGCDVADILDRQEGSWNEVDIGATSGESKQISRRTRLPR